MARNGKSILFIHQNFPAQFVHVVDALKQRGDRLAAIGGRNAKGIPSVDLRRWTTSRTKTPDLYAHAVKAEVDLISAEGAATAALKLRDDGFVPDVIVGHPGWGETLHMKEVFPDARLILFGEYFYRTANSEAHFNADLYGNETIDFLRINARNVALSLACSLADRIICPTPFQASTFPALLQPNIRVAHEGIDLRKAKRVDNPRYRVPGGRVLSRDMPVITYVSRYLEPIRGFHRFVAALPALQQACPDAEVLVIGREVDAGYGATAPGGKTWKAHLLDQLDGQIDLSRVHFAGYQPHADMIAALSLGVAHVYLTAPFVLSWSLVEAMACGCNVIASDTAPVRDAITDGVNGTLVDYHDAAALAAAMTAAVREPDASAPLREAARQTAHERFSVTAGTAAWLEEIDALA